VICGNSKHHHYYNLYFSHPRSGCHYNIIIFDVNWPETVRADLSAMRMEEYCRVVVENKTDLPLARRLRCPRRGAALDFKDELVPLSGSPSSSLATPEGE
jgi:hypothetical protein